MPYVLFKTRQSMTVPFSFVLRFFFFSFPPFFLSLSRAVSRSLSPNTGQHSSMILFLDNSSSVILDRIISPNLVSPPNSNKLNDDNDDKERIYLYNLQ